MPTSLCNAPETFQPLINNVFYDILVAYLVIYSDDLLIYRKYDEIHYKHLKIIFSELNEDEVDIAAKM